VGGVTTEGDGAGTAVGRMAADGEDECGSSADGRPQGGGYRADDRRQESYDKECGP